MNIPPSLTHIVLTDLSRLDLADLKKRLPSGALQILEEKKVPGGGFGELTTAVVAVLVTTAALQALATYFTTKYRGKRGSDEFKIVQPDGTEIWRKVQWNDSTGEPLPKSVYDKLATMPELKNALKDE